MPEKTIGKMGHRSEWIAAGIGILLVTGGCAGESRTPSSTVTPAQVRGDADKTFEKLKEEEKDRAAGSKVAPY